MADAESLKKVEQIVKEDDDRRFIVVSAPGKSSKYDTKVTDLLYRCFDEVQMTGSCANSFSEIRKRFKEIVSDLKINIDIDSILDETEKGINENKTTPDYAASRGEYLSARVFAAYIGYQFIDAFDLIRFDSKGALNDAYTNDKIITKLKDVEKAVIPGFYGKDSFGNVKVFSRGGSDITGSIIAKGVNADLYENWTDVSGFKVCDPRIVHDPKTIKCLSYKELRELSYMGASVLHSESIFPVMHKKIPINIKNTFNPQEDGTMIVPTEMYHHSDNNVITGIAGKKNFSVIFIEKSMMNSEVGLIRKVLTVVEHYGICVEHLPSGIDTLSVVIASEELKNGILSDIVNSIRESIQPDYIHVIENIALIATVGHGMARKAGVAARLFKALAEEGINIMLIDQGSSELNIIVGVQNDDYTKTVKAIYNEFINK